MAANDRPNAIGTDDKICLDGTAARKLHDWSPARCGHLGTLQTLVIELVGECCAKLVKHRLPRRERRRVGEPLNHSAVAVKKLALNARNAEGSPRGDPVRCHPIEHLILDDQTAALALKQRWRLLVNLHVAAQAAQCDASG